jgi:hypothetical protein
VKPCLKKRAVKPHSKIASENRVVKSHGFAWQRSRPSKTAAERAALLSVSRHFSTFCTWAKKVTQNGGIMTRLTQRDNEDNKQNKTKQNGKDRQTQQEYKAIQKQNNVFSLDENSLIFFFFSIPKLTMPLYFDPDPGKTLTNYQSCEKSRQRLKKNIFILLIFLH